MGAVAEVFHTNEVLVDEAVVRGLLVDQFPVWAHLPLERVVASGTDHVLYRLGDDLVVRLPRVTGVEEQAEKEREWLPRLAPLLPSRVPESVAVGQPSDDYPFAWSVYRWLSGTTPDAVATSRDLAFDLARFVAALREIDPTGGPPPGPQNFWRGEPLAARDAATRRAIAELGGTIDAEGVTAAWDQALSAPPWLGEPAWVHGDLASENLLLVDGRLAAVLDFGCLGVGDPACDLIVAWSSLSRGAREAFRVALAVDDAEWARGRGWALSTALIALPYYAETHAPRVANARYRTAEVVAEVREDAP